MKQMIAVLLILLSTTVFSQTSKSKMSVSDIPAFDIDSTTHLVVYTDVVKVPGINKDSLYALGQAWTKKYFKSSTTIMQVQNKEEGILEGRHNFYVMRDMDGVQTKGDLITYTFTLQFRDGRYKYTVTKINIARASYYGIENWINDEEKNSDPNIISYLEQIDEYMQKFTQSILDGIKPPAAKKADNW